LVGAARRGHPSAAYMAGLRAKRAGRTDPARELLAQALAGGVTAAKAPLAELDD